MTLLPWIRLLLLSLVYLLPLSEVLGQIVFYKFQIKKEGVYKLSKAQLSQIGFSKLSEISFYGYPGPLPQKLNSTQLSLEEIPAWESGDELFVFLSGPDPILLKDATGVNFTNNPYSDSLSFLIGLNSNPKRIQEIPLDQTASSPTTLYQWSAFTDEKTNLLTSGRNWYSKPISSGGLKSIPLERKTESEAPWKFSGTLMAQSFDNSELKLQAFGEIIYESQIGPIPNTTYGVKGKEIEFFTEYSPQSGILEEINILFNSPSSGSSGYFREILVGTPHESIDLKEGVYFNHSLDKFQIQTRNQAKILDVSEYFQPGIISSSGDFTLNTQKLAVFIPENCPEISELQHADLSLKQTSTWPELLIISPKSLSFEAEKLATHKLQMGIYAEVAYLDEIYDSFGYGNPDLVAIRNFIAWHFHQGAELKNVLLFGKGTFDYKGILGGRPNLVPIYTSRNSLNPLSTFSSDDFFALIDWGQGEWEESQDGDEEMQIGVGRIPVTTPQEAAIVVNKIIDYESVPNPGPWKKSITFVADDGDNNIHVRDAENHSDFLREAHPEFLQNKIYLDRYTQVSKNGLQSSPDAKKSLQEILENGTLLINYIGHGNETTLAAEEIFRIEDIPNWADQDKLALWVTATCEFGRHDSPYIRSAAEELLIAQNKGAIGLLTTGRPVFSSANYSLNEAFIQEVFLSSNQQYQDLGSIFKNTKNNSLNGILNRNFSLLGDPSIKLANTEYSIRLSEFTDVNGDKLQEIPSQDEVWYEAEIYDPISNLLLSNFSGSYEIEIRDKARTETTLGDESPSIEFQDENSILFSGSGVIEQGKIRGKFRIPLNTDFTPETATIRFYGLNPSNSEEAFGVDQPQITEGSGSWLIDQTGPDIRVSFESKPEGPWIFPMNSLFTEVFLADSSGIDISGITEGQNISVNINGKETKILNNLYRANSNSYTKGSLSFQLEGLEEGLNQITFQAFDLKGNGTSKTFEILIEGSTRLQILSHKVYPNPSEVQSNFEIKHNQPGETLVLTLVVLNINGQTLFEESMRFVKAEAVIDGISWIFSQNQTKYPAKGTYIYNLSLKSEADNSTATASGKIVIQ
ncbi:type IX secretion system sortase PorU [Algoriphagus sp. CAU 1675]|uniref:type IX secretion system sortase PorU n=1 Tax=Algoriphagus sp. CAU 1675 TaxID=3032597 RepID=UPI0023DC9968|nr:type IX secretion system sortase PorU [Algoriphagus sp. CAU 1675]MDF2157147.1 type IX secretion system sortase PorU [Algoriphagus sp. CAU 1675]